MVFQRIILVHDLQPEGGPQPVFRFHGLQRVQPLFLCAHCQMLSQVPHLQRRDVRLENQLRDVRARCVPLLQFIPDMLQFTGAPVVFRHHLHIRQFPSHKPQYPAVMNLH